MNNTNTKLEQALILHNLGLSIIPLGFDKKPLIEWKPFQSESSSEEQIQKWFSNPEVNIGVITGKISNLVVIDIDPRHGGTDEAFKGIQTVKSATGGGGWHYYFKYRDGIQNAVNIKPGIDIRGEAGYVVAPPSSHISGINYDWITAPVNEDSFALLPEFVNEWVYSQKNGVSTENNGVSDLVNGVSEGQRNGSAASVVGKLLSNFKAEEWESQVWPLFQGWNQKNSPPLPDSELRAVYESISKRERNKASETETPKKVTKGDKVIYALDLPGVLEVLKENNQLVWFTEDNRIATIHIDDDDKVYCPPPIESIPYLVPSVTEVLKYVEEFRQNPNHTLDIYDELIAYHKNISDLPHNIYYDLLALWDFHCYCLDKLHFSPIIYLYAVKERGKSRTGKGCIYVSRRGVWTETVREADIIRWGNDHKAALGFDVKDALKKFERANCDDLILARFEKGSTSSRTLWPERGAFKDTKTFKLFGPTIIATNRPVDDIVESRSISIDMKPTSRVFNKPVTPEDALDLKCKLTAWRIVHYKDELVEADKPAPGRLGDILDPLYKIVLTYFPDKKESFFRLLKTIELRKKDDATDTLEAKVLEIVMNLEDQVENGFLPVEVVTNKFNEGKGDRFTLTEDTIGKILRGLGFEKRRTANKRGIYYSLDLIERLKLNYGLNVTTDTSDTDKDIPNNDNQVSEASDVPTSASQESHESLKPNKTIDELNPSEQPALGKEIFGEGTNFDSSQVPAQNNPNFRSLPFSKVEKSS